MLQELDLHTHCNQVFSLERSRSCGLSPYWQRKEDATPLVASGGWVEWESGKAGHGLCGAVFHGLALKPGHFETSRGPGEGVAINLRHT